MSFSFLCSSNDSDASGKLLRHFLLDVCLIQNLYLLLVYKNKVEATTRKVRTSVFYFFRDTGIPSSLSEFMGVCDGCAVNFRKLSSQTCMKCNKLQKTTSDVERLAVEVRSYILFLSC